MASDEDEAMRGAQRRTQRDGPAGMEASTTGGILVPSEMRFSELRRYVEQHGWILVRISGSHHVFQMPDGGLFSVPVHGGRVKPVYVRQIKKIIEGKSD